MAGVASVPSTYFEWATQLLDTCNAALEDTVGGVIGRAFVTAGNPIPDCCPQITVHGSSLGEDALAAPATAVSGSGQSPRIQRVNLIGFVVTVFRCMPGPQKNGEPPLPEVQEDAGQKVLEDVWAIWNGIISALRDGTLWEGTCTAIYFDQANPIDPAGGCGGWQIPIRVNLGGIPRNGST